MIIWLVGMSGAGKSTIGREVYSIVKPILPNTVFIDGDEVREVFRHDGEGDYSLEGRLINSQRISAMCRWLDLQNINVVCTMLSIFEDHRQANRTAFSRYFEVYVESTIEDLKTRDYKHLYRDALAGRIKNVVGFDIPFTPPTAPDLVIKSGNPPVNKEEAGRLIVTESGILQ